MKDGVNIGSPDGTENADGRAADDVFRRIADRTLSGEPADGQPPPPEREIMDAFGVSRTVVREAVPALAKRGLVQARPSHRPVVRKPSCDTALDTRVMMEASLARQAALDARKEDIAAMQAALMANEAAIESSGLFDRTDLEFHSTVYCIPGNQVQPAIHRACTAWLSSYWYRMPSVPDRSRAGFEFHSRIFGAILMRDPDTAGNRLKLYLACARDQVRETFENA